MLEYKYISFCDIFNKKVIKRYTIIIQKYCTIEIFVISLYYKQRGKTMRTDNFRAAVDEIRKNGGSRQTMYINEVWRSREMTIFGYADNTAEVFEDVHSFMAFNSTAEAVAAIKKIQADYDKAVEENKRKYDNRLMKVESYTIEEWYWNAPRGTYFGD